MAPDKAQCRLAAGRGEAEPLAGRVFQQTLLRQALDHGADRGLADAEVLGHFSRVGQATLFTLQVEDRLEIVLLGGGSHG